MVGNYKIIIYFRWLAGRWHLTAKYEIMDTFLGNGPATQSKVVIDSLADQCTSNADYEVPESDSDDSGKPAESKTTTTTAYTGNSMIDVNSSDEPTLSAKPKECPDVKPKEGAVHKPLVL